MTGTIALGIRATVLYVFLLVLLRLSGRRTVAEATPLDVVVALIIGDLPDDIIWGEVPLAQGLVAIGVMLALHVLVTTITARVPRLDRLVESAPTRVVAGGRLLAHAMRRERLNEHDVRWLVRKHGLDDIGAVDEARIEASGELSLRRDEPFRPATRADRRRAGRLAS